MFKMPNLRQEFQLNNFKFSHRFEKDFVHSHCLPIPVLIIYRGLFALYSISWIIYRITTDESFRQVKKLFQATYWAYFTLIMYFLLAFINTTLHYIYQDEGEEIEDNEEDMCKHDATKWYDKLQWLLYDIASNMAIGVTLYFWAFDYKGTGVSLSDINVHILNSVFMIIDHALSSMPWRLFHVYYSILFSVMYTNATIFYWIWVDKQPIYRVLDYSKRPGLAAMLIFGGMSVVLPFIQLLLYVIYRFRLYLVGREVKELSELDNTRGSKLHIV